MMKTLARNKTVRKLANTLLRIKKTQPAKYHLIENVTDGMIMGTWIILSLLFALWIVDLGILSFETAMFTLCIADLYFVFAMSSILEEEPDDEFFNMDDEQ